MWRIGTSLRFVVASYRPRNSYARLVIGAETNGGTIPKRRLSEYVQKDWSRADRTNSVDTPESLTAYYIGAKRIDASWVILEQASQSLINKLGTNTLLPGRPFTG